MQLKVAVKLDFTSFLVGYILFVFSFEIDFNNEQNVNIRQIFMLIVLGISVCFGVEMYSYIMDSEVTFVVSI